MMRVKTLKSLFPEPQPPHNKNFIKENVKNLRKMEKLFHANGNVKGLKFSTAKQTKFVKNINSNQNNHDSNNDKEKSSNNRSEDLIANGVANLLNDKSYHNNQYSRKKITPVPMNKKNSFKKTMHPINGNILRKSHDSKEQVSCKNEDKKLKALSDGDISGEKFNEELGNEMKIKCRSQGVQTLNFDDVDSIYSDGIIRYPSGKNKESQTAKSKDRGDTLVPETNQTNSIHHSELSLNDDVDHIKINKERVSLASKLASQLNNSTPHTNHRVGIVPKYIKERKQALQKEEQAKAAAKYSDCPQGHIPLPDNERKETLSMLKKNYQDFVRELNMFPIRTDTLRSHKRKMEIEKQLAKLEEAIKVFSRPKVFVKVDS